MIAPSDILLRAGGRTLARHGVPFRRLFPPARGGELAGEVFSRADAATCATYVDRTGVVRQAAAHKLRQDWYDLDGDGVFETPALLLEGARTNGWTKSQKLDDAAWTKFHASVTADATTAPDGTLTADKLVEDGTNNLHDFNRVPPAMTNNLRQAVSVCAKAGERSWFRIKTTDKAGLAGSTWFNLATGAVGTTDANHVAWVRRLANGWFRCMLGWKAGTGAGAGIVEFILATGDALGAYLGDGASGAYFWGMDFEADKSSPSSCVATDAAAVTRAADVMWLPMNFGPMDLSIYLEFVRPHTLDIAAAPAAQRCGLLEIADNIPGTLDVACAGAPPDTSVDISTGTGTFVLAGGVPAGNLVDLVAQIKNLRTGGQAALNIGAGLTAFSAPNGPMPSFFSQKLFVGSTPFYSATAALQSGLVDLIVARGLHTIDEFRRVP